MNDQTQDELVRQTQAESLVGVKQDKEQLRGTRKALRGHEEKANEMKDNATAITAEQYISQVQELDNTFKSNVHAPAEATLDSRALRLLSEAALKKSRSLKTDLNAFDGDEFVQRFIQVMRKRAPIEAAGDSSGEENGTDHIDWLRVGRRVMRFSRRAPTMDLMYGPLELQHKKRKFSQRAKLEKNEADRREPEQIKSNDIERSQNEMSRLIIKIGDLLSTTGGQDGMNLFQFFINPDSFAQSVENLFCLSFLIRDGKAAIDIENEEGIIHEYPLVYSTEAAAAAEHQKGFAKTQVILELTIQDWQDAIECFGIKKSVIPHREDQAPNQSTQKWH